IEAPARKCVRSEQTGKEVREGLQRRIEHCCTQHRTERDGAPDKGVVVERDRARKQAEIEDLVGWLERGDDHPVDRHDRDEAEHDEHAVSCDGAWVDSETSDHESWNEKRSCRRVKRNATRPKPVRKSRAAAVPTPMLKVRKPNCHNR